MTDECDEFLDKIKEKFSDLNLVGEKLSEIRESIRRCESMEQEILQELGEDIFTMTLEEINDYLELYQQANDYCEDYEDEFDYGEDLFDMGLGLMADDLGDWINCLHDDITDNMED